MMNPVSEFAPSIKSLGKILLQSAPWRRNSLRGEQSEPIIILGNGPSLRQTIDEHGQQLAHSVTMAVNFAANAPEFNQLQPNYYILVDPHFFLKQDDENVARLWHNIASAPWQMTLIVPRKDRKRLPHEVLSNKLITIAEINPVGVEGWNWLQRAAYSRGWGMPRPRNVLIPAIMSAIWLGFREIYVAGADHSWLKTLSVDDDNHVVSIQPHFYKENEKEQQRIRTDYLQYPLHQILESFTIAFRSYHRLQSYALSRGIAIYNSTSSSFIDAFPRRPLPTHQ